MSFSERLVRIAVMLALFAVGIISLFFPKTIWEAAIYIAVIFMAFNTMRLILKGMRRKSVNHFFLAALSFVFMIVLAFNSFIPEWILRVIFGLYCLVSGLSILIQQGIYMYEEVDCPILNWVFSFGYCLIGFLLLFTPRITTADLIRFFGAYFLLLSVRYLADFMDLTNPKYSWKRNIHVSLPTAFAALIPDWTLQRINAHFQKGEDVETYPVKTDREPVLRAMVHIGPKGFQKVGHFSFSYKGIVYSYGNYDHDSDHIGGLLGDGVYFNVPFERYISNITKYEQNTIFEYGIQISEEQEQQLDELLAELHNSSYRWYTRIEREDGSGRFEKYEEDYGCRLHQRTGAKFYKIRKGRFKTYWALGENCVMFADLFLGKIGADVLSIRGLITPGAYFDYLQNEYEKEKSPVVSCTIHPYRPLIENREDEVETAKQSIPSMMEEERI